MDGAGSGIEPQTRHQTRPSAGEEVSVVSRYFAAAAYHDAKFRRSVLDIARHSWYRARAPEFGIDDAFVTLHCRRAERRGHLRDAVMLAMFLLIAYGPIELIFSYPDDITQIISENGPLFVLAVLGAALVLFAARFFTEHFTTRKLTRDARPGSSQVSWAATDQPQNLVVYGAYSPFVGSGYNIGGWSFAVNLERTRDATGVAADAVPFASQDVVRFVASRLDRLQIAGLNHYQVLFVDGRLIRCNAGTLLENGHPKRWIDAKTVENMDDSPASGTRSYLCANIVDWSGEIVLSVYLRFKRGETSLFAEASYFLLTPPKQSFFKIDEADPRLRVGAVARILLGSIAASVFALAAAVLSTSAWVQVPIAHWLERRRIRRAIKRNPRFNFGAVSSIRELGMENYFRVYFQKLDKEGHVKTVEQCIIDAVVEFLCLHNIDTSDIKDRRSTILNNGVIVAGGNLTAGNMSVGQNAKVLLGQLGAKVGIGPAGGSPSAASRAAAMQ